MQSYLLFYLLLFALECPDAVSALLRAYGEGGKEVIVPDREAEIEMDRALGVSYGEGGDQSWTPPKGSTPAPWAALAEETG